MTLISLCRLRKRWTLCAGNLMATADHHEMTSKTGCFGKAAVTQRLMENIWPNRQSSMRPPPPMRRLSPQPSGRGCGVSGLGEGREEEELGEDGWREGGGDGEREEGGSGVPAWPPPGTPAAGWFPSRTAPSSCPPPDREQPPPPSGLPSEPSALARASSAPPPAPPWPGEFPAAPASAASCPVEESQRPLAHFNADSSWIPECCHDPWHSCEGYITLYNKNKYLNDIVLPFCGINAKGKIKYILYLHRTTKKLFHWVKQVFICKTVISMANLDGH